jgi:hypothetical protein
MEKHKFQIEVKRAALADALKRLAKTVAKRAGEEAVLSFDGANLHIDLGGGCMTVPAEGNFDCQVRVSGKTILNLAQVLPSGDPIHIVAMNNQLQIENCVIRCKIQDAWSKIVDLPVNLSAKESVNFLADQSSIDLEISGLTALAGGLPAAIQESVRLLPPYRLTATDIETMIKAKRQKTDDDLFGGL